MFVVIALILFIFALIYFTVEKRYKFWSDLGYDLIPTDFIFGNLKGVGSKIASFERFDELYKAYKGKTETVGMYMFLSPTLMILDLELLKNIYIRDFQSFHDRGFYFNKKDDPLSANMVKNFNVINQLLELN